MTFSNPVSRTARQRLVVFLGLAGAMNLACSSNIVSCDPNGSSASENSEACADAYAGGAGQSSVATAGAGGSVVSNAGDTGSASPDVGGSTSAPCNALTLDAQPVAAESHLNALLPLETRGPISSGQYALTKAEWFGDSAASNVAATLSVAVQGSTATIQGVFSLGANVDAATFTSTLTTIDPVTSFYTCETPAGGLGVLPPLNTPTPADYSATSDTLSLAFRSGADHGFRLTFTKR